MKLTSTQRQAIAAQGNVLVIAGAGTGKTRTLVERCLNCLLRDDSPADLSELLVVTFTEAAAAEMRQRLRDRLQQEVENSSRNARAAQQLALFETAHIGTLHSFCLELVRRHFYLLELDPQLTVMSEEEARLLANEELEKLFAEKYAEKSREADAVRDLIAAQGDGSDHAIRNLVFRLHEYGQTLPDPDGWMAGQRREFSSSDPGRWREWLQGALAGFRQEWLQRMKDMAAVNPLARECAALIESLATNRALTEAVPIFTGMVATRDKCPTGKKSALLEPLNGFYKDAEYLRSILPNSAGSDPLAEDWGWVCARMATLLELTSQFTSRFSRAKRELALADFHDLEQFALRLLWDNETNAPTKIARQWRKTFRHVLVDEYQDINAAQDQILQALSREGKEGNRFLVGDLKQSIYRFRLAAPRIFQSYVQEWRKEGTVIPLVENFRSRERILDFINSAFERLMVQEVGGIGYGEDARLKFGAPDERRELAAAATNEPRVEFQLRLRRSGKSKENGEPPAEGGESLADLEEAAKEARLIAIRLRDLRASGHQIWDEDLGACRPVEWKDMAILLRAPAVKTEFYVREFSRLNVPLAAARGRFYESTEISDTLSLLGILDNPLQDLPVLAALRSPIVGLSLEDLARIRMAGEGPIWTALLRWHENVTGGRARCPQRAATGEVVGAVEKVARFLERFSRWRAFTRQMSLSSCLEEILSETRYSEWLLTQPRGEERFANLQGLVNLTRKFDRFQRQGLLRFLLFIEAQKATDAEPQVPSVIDENAVRLMSIHQSKGLEFPVVVIADTGKAFNLQDLRAEVILDDVYGICPLIKPPRGAKRYPSLPYWLARRRQRNELLGEELRLLYVAVTRARDTLILSATISKARFENLWMGDGNFLPDPIASAGTVADWLGFWFSRNVADRSSEAKSGTSEWLRWQLQDDGALAVMPSAESSTTASPLPLFLQTTEEIHKIQTRLAWNYPFVSATWQPAKSSVSLLRQEAVLEDDEAVQYFDFQRPAVRMRFERAADAGSATHAFLERVTIETAGSEPQLRREIERLVKEKVLTPEQAALISVENVARFWKSGIGRGLQSQAAFVERELPFTAKLRLNELSSILGRNEAAGDLDDFVVIQGIADLAVLLPESIQLVDFKTDNVAGAALAERAKQYEPQLKLYSLALSRIYKRPVTGAWLYFLAAGKAVSVSA